MVVFDDDPTGIQTVHGCLLITDWKEDNVRKAMTDTVPFFYILTNTRAMTREDAARVVRSAMEAVLKVNESLGCQLILVSRSDSCLRGHFPLETDVMRHVLREHGINTWSKIPFCPAFIESGRVTIDGTHYMKDGNKLIPVSETEFARDNVFAYHTSVLKDYIREKGANPDDYEIVNASTYDELYKYADKLAHDMAGFDGDVVIRSSSSLPKAISGISDKPFLGKEILGHNDAPGFFIVGSHVKKTTRQLDRLLQQPNTHGIEVDIERILHNPQALMNDVIGEIKRTADSKLIPVVYTSRKEVRLDDADKRQHLGQTVSDFLVDIVRRLPYTPSYLVAKGGITSNDIMTKGLGVRCARVLGQVINSVPCVMTEHFPYIIFPGNVGDENSLAFLTQALNSSPKEII